MILKKNSYKAKAAYLANSWTLLSEGNKTVDLDQVCNQLVEVLLVILRDRIYLGTMSHSTPLHW